MFKLCKVAINMDIKNNDKTKKLILIYLIFFFL